MSHKPTKSCPISSTPHPNRKLDLITHLFESDTLSPIVNSLEYVKEPSKQYKPTSKSTRPATKIKSSVPKKKRCKDKEPASSAVLKEMGVTEELVNGNNLSQSRNAFNMYPQPIIVDSDEEDEPLFITKSNPKKTPKKKVQTENKSATISTINNANKKEIDIQEKESQMLNRKKNATILRGSQNKQSTSCRNGTVTRASRKNTALHDLSNNNSVIINQSTHMFSENKIMLERKKKKHNITIDIDSTDDAINTVEWSPRTLQNVKNTDEVKTVEDIKINKPYKQENEKNVAKSSKQSCESLTKNCQIEHVRNVHSIEKQNDNAVKHEDTEYLSRFENAVFKSNKNNGGIVANCLQTDRQKFGYIEVQEGETFTGKRHNVTFVVLEGSVKADIHQVAIHALSAGDILHVTTDSGFQFTNIGSSHARLLYVKEKS